LVGDVFEVVRVMKDLVLQDIELCKQVLIDLESDIKARVLIKRLEEKIND
jgi:hypothetical protein